MKKRIVVCSKNPVKVASIRNAFKALKIDIIISSISCPSSVADQPMSEEEALQGARNRIVYARGLKKDSDIFIAIESGIRFCKLTKKYFDFSYTVVQGKNTVDESVSKSTEFEIEKDIINLVKQGNDLDQASSLFYKIKNLGKSLGISGISSNRIIPRKTLHFQANVFAIVGFLRIKNDISPSRMYRRFQRTFLTTELRK